jgi:hypothetical protein
MSKKTKTHGVNEAALLREPGQRSVRVAPKKDPRTLFPYGHDPESQKVRQISVLYYTMVSAREGYLASDRQTFGCL